jgi:hypothetical protein
LCEDVVAFLATLRH